MTARSTLVVRGAAVEIHALELDGALVIEVADGASLVINSLAVKNDGWEFRELSDDEQAREEEATAIRGYRLVRHDAKYLKVAAGEHIVVEEGPQAKRASLSQIETRRTTKEGPHHLDRRRAQDGQGREGGPEVGGVLRVELGITLTLNCATSHKAQKAPPRRENDVGDIPRVPPPLSGRLFTRIAPLDQPLAR